MGGPHVETVSVLPTASDNPDRIIKLSTDGKFYHSNGSNWNEWNPSGGISAGQVANNAIDDTKIRDSGANTIMGRANAVSGDPADISIGANTVLGRQGGDVVAAQVATGQIADDAVTYAKMQNVSATSRLLGRASAGAGNPEELTGTQATALLDAFSSSNKGLVPASGGGTSNFLRADGSFAAPPSGGGAWTTIVKTADEARTNNSLADDGVLKFNTSPNTQYVIRLKVFMITNATADSKYRMAHTGTTTRVRRRINRTATGDIPAEVATQTAFDAADVVLSTTGLNPFVEEVIVLQVGASGGVLSFQWAQNTTNASPCTVLEGSYLEYATS